jgi:hypothetical protein
MNVFASQPNWIEPVRERIGFLTDILPAYDGSEQRIRLRETANGGIAFRVTCPTAREWAQLQSLITAKQSEIIHVPWWPDAQPLLAAVNALDTELEVDTADRDFAAEHGVILWRNAFQYEAGTIAALTTSGLSLADGLDSGFAAGTLVIPLKACRLAFEQTVTQPTTDVAELDVQFTTEAEEMPAYAGAEPTQWLGMDVLTLQPNNAPDFETEHRRQAVLLDSRAGVRASDDHADLSFTSRGFNWWAKGRTSIAALKAFLHRRKGRAVPFWLPTWRRDLPLAEAIAAGETFDIKDVGYTELQFPFVSRRHIALISTAGDVTIREIAYAVDNGDGTETITVSGALPEMPASTMVSLLTLMRLADDQVEIEWSTRAMAQARVPVTEIPREVLS